MHPFGRFSLVHVFLRATRRDPALLSSKVRRQGGFPDLATVAMDFSRVGVVESFRAAYASHVQWRDKGVK